MGDHALGLVHHQDVLILVGDGEGDVLRDQGGGHVRFRHEGDGHRVALGHGMVLFRRLAVDEEAALLDPFLDAAAATWCGRAEDCPKRDPASSGPQVQLSPAAKVIGPLSGEGAPCVVTLLGEGTRTERIAPVWKRLSGDGVVGAAGRPVIAALRGIHERKQDHGDADAHAAVGDVEGGPAHGMPGMPTSMKSVTFWSMQPIDEIAEGPGKDEGDAGSSARHPRAAACGTR